MNVKCDNCDWVGDASEVQEIRNFWERVEAGNEMPAGECPKCSCLAYNIVPQDTATKEQLTSALRNLLDCVEGMDQFTLDADFQDAADTACVLLAKLEKGAR